jgi:hypothetical protein
MFDPESPCDLCGKPLFVTSPMRTRCDQCVRYGAPLPVAPPIREFGSKGGSAATPCAGCGRDHCQDGVTVLPLVEGYCLSCRLDGAQQAG